MKAILAGSRRAMRSPVIVFWLWMINVVVALPATVIVGASLEQAIGSSRVQTNLLRGFDVEWYDETKTRTSGIGSTFTPAVAGAGAFYKNLDAWLSGSFIKWSPVLVGTGAAYALLWGLMLGGVLDRYARPDERPGVVRFFRNGGRYFFRFVRLAVAAGVLYGAVFYGSRWLFGRVELLTRDATSEGTVLAWSVLGWLFVAFLLTLIHMSFGYAKIATVVDGRRSMLFAALRGVGFVLRHPGKTGALYYGLLLVSAVLLAVYALAAPVAGPSTGLTVVFAFAAGQLFLIAKLMMRLWLLASQTELYRSHVRTGQSTTGEILFDDGSPTEEEGPGQLP